MTLSHQQLLHWNSLGLIPGPNEIEEEFVRRANYCLTLLETLPKEHGHLIPQEVMDKPEGTLVEKGWNKIKEKYDFIPNWVPLFFSNYQLALWHGGCAWIFQITENHPLGALLQLRRCFKFKERFLFFYSRDLLIAHEACHIGRMAFNEPQFEEILAYRTASNPIQRWLGPLAVSSKETALFVLVLFLLVIVDIAALTLDVFSPFLVLLHLFPIALMSFALIRLMKRHNRFNRCLKHLSSVFNLPEAVIYRLTDQEIQQFSSQNAETITRYAQEQSIISLRWQLIQKAYQKHD